MAKFYFTIRDEENPAHWYCPPFLGNTKDEGYELESSLLQESSDQIKRENEEFS